MTKAKTSAKTQTKKKEAPNNPVATAPLKVASKKKKELVLPKIPVKDIAFKIADTGIPKEILEMHLTNLANGDNPGRKPRHEMAVRMLFCLADGWSLSESALLCGCSANTIFRHWGNPKSPWYDEAFSQIISLGVHLSELWWASVGRANLNNKKSFDSTLWMMNMSNRFGWTRALDGKVIERWDHLVKEDKKTHVHHINTDTLMKAVDVLKSVGIKTDIKKDAIDVESSVEG